MFLNMIHQVSPPIGSWLLWSNRSSGWIFSSLGKWITSTNTFLALSIFLTSYPNFISWQMFRPYAIDYMFLIVILVVLNFKRTRIALNISVSTQRLVIFCGILL